MFGAVVEKEIREIIGSCKFAYIFGGCALLILLSFYMGANDYKLNRDRYEAARAQNLERFAGVSSWFHVQGNAIYLPPQPLSSLVAGISNDIGRSVSINRRGEPAAKDSRFNEDPIFAIFRPLDIEFIFQIVLSLFAILLGYDAVSGEKERGTLRLSFANAVPRATYILGKLIGLFVALSVPVMIAVAVGSLLLPLLGVPMGVSEWARLGLINIAGLVYFGSFLSLSVFISTLTRRSSTSFLFLLVTWIALVMVIPRASVLLAGRAVDVLSADEIAAEKATLESQLAAEYVKEITTFSVTGTDNAENAVNEFLLFSDNLADEHEAKVLELSAHLNERRFNQQQEQQALAFSFARISPAASLSLAVSALAGTSISLERHYHDQAAAYQSTYREFIDNKIGLGTGGSKDIVGSFVKSHRQLDSVDPNELPQFLYEPTSLSESLGATAMDMGLLVLFNLLFFSGAFVAFLGYDVR